MIGKRASSVILGAVAIAGAALAIIIALSYVFGEQGVRSEQPARQSTLEVSTPSNFPKNNWEHRVREPSASLEFETPSWDLDPLAADNEIPEQDVSAFSPDAPLEELLTWWYDHPDERFRIAALEAISVHTDDHQQILAVLAEALDNPSLGIRRAALTLLAQADYLWPDSEHLIWLSLRDPDPAIRQLASVLYSELKERALAASE